MARTTGTFTIGRTSQLSGEYHTMELPISESDFITRYNQWQRGMHIQNAFSNLTASQREFIMTGITPEEWDEMASDDYDPENSCPHYSHEHGCTAKECVCV